MLFANDSCQAEGDNDSDQELDQDALNEIVAGQPSNHDPQSLESLRERLNDQTFQIFPDRITERPNVKDQVLRYNCSWPNAVVTDDDGATGYDGHSSTSASSAPLWIRHDHQPTHVNSCRNCSTILPSSVMTRLLAPLPHLARMPRLPLARTSIRRPWQPSNKPTHFCNKPHPKPSRRTWSNLETRPRNACVGDCWKVIRLNWGVVAVYTCPHSSHGSAPHVCLWGPTEKSLPWFNHPLTLPHKLFVYPLYPNSHADCSH
jgi:hypothetical protein